MMPQRRCHSARFGLAVIIIALSTLGGPFAMARQLEDHPDRVHRGGGRKNHWTAAKERALRELTRSLRAGPKSPKESSAKSPKESSAKSPKSAKSSKKSKGSKGEPEVCQTCLFGFSYKESTAFQVVNGQIVNTGQVTDEADEDLAICDDCGCNSGDATESSVVASIEGECDPHEMVDVSEVIITHANADEDGIVEMFCPDMSYDMEADCRAYRLDTRQEIIPAPILVVLNSGPLVRLQLTDRSANYYCTFTCIDVGLGVPVPEPTQTPTQAPTAAPTETSAPTETLTPTQAPIIPSEVPSSAPTLCDMVTSDGTAAFPHVGYLGPTTFCSQQYNPIAVARNFCLQIPSAAYSSGTVESQSNDPCSSSFTEADAFFLYINTNGGTGSDDAEMLATNAQITALCCL